MVLHGRRPLARAVRRRPRRHAEAWPSSWSRASRLLSKVDWRTKGLEDLGRPDGFHERQVDRWTRFLERIKGQGAARLRRGIGVAACPSAGRLRPRAHARRLPVRQRHVPPRRTGAARRHRRLGDGDGRRPQARSRVGGPELAGGHHGTRGGRARAMSTCYGMPSRDELLGTLRRRVGTAGRRHRLLRDPGQWKLAVVLEQGFQRAGDDEKLQAFGPIVLDLMADAAELAESTNYGR